MIERLINRALAGVQYLLTVAVSVVVVVIAIVAFRSVLQSPDEPDATTSPTTSSSTTATEPPARGQGSRVAAPATTGTDLDCVDPPPRDGDGTRFVRLYYACAAPDSQPGGTWVYREIGAEGGVLTLTMETLVAGPTVEERRNGFRSLFSPATSDAVLSVSRTDGAVIVDLRDLGPMPSLAVEPDGLRFLATLNNTLFQHDAVSSIEYRIEGSCERFWEYFNENDCRVVRRADWRQNPYAAL